MSKRTLGLVTLPVAAIGVLAKRLNPASMGDSVTVSMKAPVSAAWDLITDVTNTKSFSEETFDAEWLGGATEPAVGARFRGRVKRNGRGPAYWTECRIDQCEPHKDFGFSVLGGSRTVNTWRYQFAETPEGVDVTESFQLADSPATRAYWAVAGSARRKTNLRNMRATLNNVKRQIES